MNTLTILLFVCSEKVTQTNEILLENLCALLISVAFFLAHAHVSSKACMLQSSSHETVNGDIYYVSMMETAEEWES